MVKNPLATIIDPTAFKVIDAICGSGKSHSALQLIKTVRLQNSKQIIIVAKTVSLCEQWYEQVKPLGFNIFFYNHSNCISPVHILREELREHISPKDLFIMTEAAFEMLLATNSIPKRDTKIVIHDEFMTPYNILTLDCPQSHELITKGIKATEHTTGIYTLTSKDNSLLTTYQNSNDSVYEKFKPLATAILNSQNFTVEVSKSDWDSYTSNVKKGKDQLELYAFKNDKMYHGFYQFYLLGALFKTTLLEKTFKDTKFVDSTYEFNFRGNTKTHSNGDLIQVCYLFDTRYSRYFIEGSDRKNKVWNEIVSFINEKFTDEAICYINVHKMNQKNNSGFNRNFIIESPNVIGINSYDKINTSIYLASTNPTDVSVSYFAKKGITRAEIDKSRTRYNMYQAMMRDASRNPDNKELVVWVVPTKSDAYWLHSLLQDANEPIKLETGIKESVKIKFDDPEITKKIKNTQQDEKKRWKKLENKPDTFVLTVDKFNSEKGMEEIKQDEFIQFWTSCKEKGEGHVINACFNKQRSKKLNLDKLDKESHQYSNGLFFDIDNDGNEVPVTYEDFTSVFPDVKIAFRESTTKGNFHVFIPTKQKLSYNAYKDIQLTIMSFLSGLDTATIKATQKMHYEKGIVGSFVQEGTHLDVTALYESDECKQVICDRLTKEDIESKSTNEHNLAKTTNYQKAEKAVDNFNKIPHKEKHNKMYGLVQSLRKSANMTDNEIVSYCSSNVVYFLEDRTRLVKLEEIIKKQ